MVRSIGQTLTLNKIDRKEMVSNIMWNSKALSTIDEDINWLLSVYENFEQKFYLINKQQRQIQVLTSKWPKFMFYFHNHFTTNNDAIYLYIHYLQKYFIVPLQNESRTNKNPVPISIDLLNISKFWLNWKFKKKIKLKRSNELNS